MLRQTQTELWSGRAWACSTWIKALLHQRATAQSISRCPELGASPARPRCSEPELQAATSQQCGRVLKRYTACLGLACSPGTCHLHGDKAGDSRADLHLWTRCFLGWQKAVCSLTVFLQPFLSSIALWLSKVLVSSITPVKNFVSEKTLRLLKLTRAVMTGTPGFAGLSKTMWTFFA